MRWKRHGLCKFNQVLRECDALLTTSGVLGRLEDGLYLCEIVRLERTKQGYDITIKHGSHILSDSMPRRIYPDLQWATDWDRPQGGKCVFKIVKGKIEELGRAP